MFENFVFVLFCIERSNVQEHVLFQNLKPWWFSGIVIHPSFRNASEVVAVVADGTCR